MRSMFSYDHKLVAPLGDKADERGPSRAAHMAARDLTLKLRVPVVTTVIHGEGKAAAAVCDLQPTARRGLGGNRLVSAALGCGHAGGLGLELLDRMVHRRRGCCPLTIGFINAKEGNRRLQLLGL